MSRSATAVAAVLAVLISSAGPAALASPETESQAQNAPESPTGLKVFTRDGIEAGEVLSTTRDGNGALIEIVVETGVPLGIGTRVVAVDGGKFVTLFRAVVLDFSAGELSELPALDQS